MAVAPCHDVTPQVVGEITGGHNSTSGTMVWHGLFQELLFSKGVANPPSSSHMCTTPTNTTAARTPAVTFQGRKGDRDVPCTVGSLLSAAALESVQDFLSDNPKVRERGCSNISRIFDALGPKAEEFAMFLQDFEEGEDDEGVLITLCNGLREFFEALDGDEASREDRSACPHAKAFNAVLDLLLRVLLHRDRELKMAAMSAFGALLAASDFTLLLRNDIISHMLELSEDERDAFRQVAALALPATLHYARRCAAELHNGRQTGRSEQEADLAYAILDFKQRLRVSYVRLCGDKNSGVQLAAGQQLPVFVDYIAKEVEALQQEQALQPKRIDGPVKEDAASTDADIAELMVAVYTATQKFTLSPNVRHPCSIPALEEYCRELGEARVVTTLMKIKGWSLSCAE
ncbi:hypothetical protein Emag_001281 [Eimeria magna]